MIDSKHRHDWVKCACGNIFVDGGRVYIRRGVADPSKYQDLSEFSPETEEEEKKPAGDQWTTTETMGQI